VPGVIGAHLLRADRTLNILGNFHSPAGAVLLI
jgi:hypothetical protein